MAATTVATTTVTAATTGMTFSEFYADWKERNAMSLHLTPREDLRSDAMKRHEGITAYFQGYASMWDVTTSKIISKSLIAKIAAANPTNEFELMETGIKPGLAAQHGNAILAICRDYPGLFEIA